MAKKATNKDSRIAPIKTDSFASGAEKRPNKVREYWAFVKWYALPVSMRDIPEDDLMELGIDEEFIGLMEIATQKAFAKKYHLSQDTLSDWKKLEIFKEDSSAMIDKTVVQQYESAIAHSFSLKTIKEGDAARVKLWHQIFKNRDFNSVEVSIKGEIKVHHTLETDRPVIDLLSLKQIIVARAAKRLGKSLPEFQYGMLNSYYALQEGNEITEYPSDVIIDFEEIETNTVHTGRKRTAEIEKQEARQISPNDGEAFKNKLLEKLGQVPTKKRVRKPVKSQKAKLKEALQKSQDKRRKS